MAALRRSRRLAQVLLWIKIELGFALGAAEVIRLPFVLGSSSGGSRFYVLWSKNSSSLPRNGSSPDRRLMPLPAHSTSADHRVVPCNAQFRCARSPLDSARGTGAGSACPGDCAPRGNGPRIAAGLGAAASPRTRSASTGIPVSPISPSVPHRRSNSDSWLVGAWFSPFQPRSTARDNSECKPRLSNLLEFLDPPGKLDCRPYRDGGEGNPKRLVEAASLAFSNRSNILTIRLSPNEMSVFTQLLQ